MEEHPLDLAEPATGVNLRPWTRQLCKYCGKGGPRLQGQAVLIPRLQKPPKRRSLRSLQQVEEGEVCCSQLLVALFAQVKWKSSRSQRVISHIVSTCACTRAHTHTCTYTRTHARTRIYTHIHTPTPGRQQIPTQHPLTPTLQPSVDRKQLHKMEMRLLGLKQKQNHS